MLQSLSMTSNDRLKRKKFDDALTKLLDEYDQYLRTKFADKVRSALLEEIDWQLYNNWKIKIPEDSKDTIKQLVFREYEAWINESVGDFEFDQKFTANPAANKVENKYFEDSLHDMNGALDDAYGDYRDIMYSDMIESSSKAKEEAKQLIRDHFKTRYGEAFKVTLWQRIKDVAGDVTGIGERHEYDSADLGLVNYEYPAQATQEENSRWIRRWKNDITALPVSH